MYSPMDTGPIGPYHSHSVPPNLTLPGQGNRGQPLDSSVFQADRHSRIASNTVQSMDILILLGLIVLSAVISTAEIGFFAVNSTKLKALAQTGNKRAKLALHLRSDPQKLLSTILVGDRLIGVATPMYATFLTLSIYGGQTIFDEAIAVMVGLLTFVHLSGRRCDS